MSPRNEATRAKLLQIRRLKNQIKAVVTNPYNVIVLIAIILLAYLIVLPLLNMLATTFQLSQRDLRATGGTIEDVGKFTFYYWQRLLASDLSWNLLIKPLLNFLTIGLGVSVCVIALGSVLAWLMLYLITLYDLAPVLVGNAVTWPIYLKIKRANPALNHRKTIAEELREAVEKENARKTTRPEPTETKHPAPEPSAPEPPATAEEAMLLYEDDEDEEESDD